MELGALLPLLVGVCLLGWVWTFNVVWRYRCRHIPGPRPSWLVGNILDFQMGKATQAMAQWADTFGAIYVWYLGRKPCIVLSDPELVRQAAMTNFPHLHDRSMFQISPGMAIESDFMNKGLFGSQGKAWAHGRSVLQQFFARDALVEHTRKMNFSADRLLDFIATSASAGTEFEATYTFSKMTMEVIGNTAFGVDFHLQTSLADTPPPSIPLPSSSSSSSSPSSPNSASRRCGFDLLSAARSLFQPLNLRGNKARIVLGLAPLLSWVQRRGVAIGGRVKALKNISLARCFIWGILQGILENNIGLDSIESIGLKSNTPETTLSSAGASTTGDMTTRKQCPMHALGKVRAKSFAKGKKSLSTLVPDTPLLFKLLRGAVNPQTEKPFTEFDICAQGFNVIIGAYETTALGMSYTLYELSKQPALQRRIAQEVAALRALKKQEEFASPSKQTRASDSTSLPFDITFDDLQHLPFTEACFLEALRLWPPVSPLVPMSRHAKEEVYLDGHKIPKGACVMFNVWHIHHNPKYFPNPEEYAPERFLPNHPELKTRHKQAFLPFGAGPRKCIGKAFSVAEAVISLARMLEQFEFRLDMTRSAELNTITTATMQPTNGVWLKVFKRRVEEQS